jgi:hypothetical protein
VLNGYHGHACGELAHRFAEFRGGQGQSCHLRSF